MRTVLCKVALVVVLSMTAPVVKGQSTVAYQWKNVEVLGGGFVSGVEYHPSEKGLLYARTDVGGAYRWDTASRAWIALTDGVSVSNANYTGVLSIGLDPNDVNRLYLATGLYTNGWSGNGALLISSDRGRTFVINPLPFKLGGNEDGRFTGERLAVDPNKGEVLFLGTSKDGLWKSSNRGRRWTKVSSFPVSTTAGAGISFVLFDRRSGSPGNATPVIYVGVLQMGNNLFKSVDGGGTWQTVAGAPSTLMPCHAVLAGDGTMYLSYMDAPGPNGVNAGAVWKYQTAVGGSTGDGTWTNIDPPTGKGGFAGIDVDAHDAQTVVVSTIDRWSPKDEIFRTTDGGHHWKPILNEGKQDVSTAPYITGHIPHWIGTLKIDPFNPSQALFGTGYGIYSTTDLQDADAGKAVTFTFCNKGLEELVVSSLICPPSGVPLLSTVLDQDGFRHEDMDSSPAGGKFQPSYGSNIGLDFAQHSPDRLVRTYDARKGNYGGWSNDQGRSWTSFASYPAGAQGPGSIALAADGKSIVWAPAGAAPAWSTDNGVTWTPSDGAITRGVALCADKVNGQEYYAYDALNGKVMVSMNGGNSFYQAAEVAPVAKYNVGQTGINAVFGREGDVWLCHPNGLYHSVNAGTSFTAVAGVQSCQKMAFGKARPKQDYPTIYIAGTIGNVYGIFRSTDAGETWDRINDDRHQFGTISALAADAHVYGRVYLGTGGRGIQYGMPGK